jgi:hypothetical protein
LAGKHLAGKHDSGKHDSGKQGGWNEPNRVHQRKSPSIGIALTAHGRCLRAAAASQCLELQQLS